MPNQAAAAPDATLAAEIRAFYLPYLKPNGDTPDSLAVLSKHATPHLRALIAADRACEIREQGVCHIDFDPIIDGQDYTLLHLPTISTSVSADGGADVTASFINDGTKIRITYHFINQSGSWLIDDLTGHDGPDPDWDLVAMLSQKI